MRWFLSLAGICLVLSGCATSSPVVSKSRLGNLEINVHTADGESVTDADLYLDGLYVGNLTRGLPVIHAKRGDRLVRVECPGFKAYERVVTVLGDPNHQVLNVTLDKE